MCILQKSWLGQTKSRLITLDELLYLQKILVQQRVKKYIYGLKCKIISPDINKRGSEQFRALKPNQHFLLF